MSRSIDERIVQMTFNNEEFERRAKTTISTLGLLEKALNPNKLTGSMSQLTQAANRLDLSGLTDALQAVNKGFNAFEEIATGALRRVGDMVTNFVVGKIGALASSLTSMTDLRMFDQGYQKYNDLTSSVQTLVNSTGKSVDQIDEYLKRLMWYSDETSFGFTDMTKALGTMVSAGGDIDKLIPMLMGVGNATAYAGKGASEFTRVIYNLNQSYSSGFLNTMDWRSIELAGVDSKQLKEQLLGVAVAMGKVSKSRATLANFRDLLSDKVFTRDVMEKAFTNFAEMTLEAEKLVSEGKFETAAAAIDSLSGKYEEFAERAFRSAQEAKSFKEAVEATQDAVSSGWMQSFQLIFGDYNESKALWTDVTSTFWDIFASGAGRRNDILTEWKQLWDDQVAANNAMKKYGADVATLLEGTAKKIDIGENLTQTQALWNDFAQVLEDVRTRISEIWNEVFDVPTVKAAGKAIFDFIENIRSGLDQIHRTFGSMSRDHTVLGALESAFKAVLTVVKTLSTIAKSFVENFIKPLGERLKPILEDIFVIVGKVNDTITNTASGISNNLGPLETIFSNVLRIIDPLISGIAKFVGWIKDLVSQNSEIHIFDGIMQGVSKTIEFLANVLNGSISLFSTLGDKLGKVFGKVKDAIGTFLAGHGSDLSGLAKGGLLAYLGYGASLLITQFGKLGKKLADIDFMNFGKYLTGGFGKGLASSISDVFGALKEGLGGLLGGGKTGLDAVALHSIADAIMELALALLVLSLVDGDKIAVGLCALAAALGGIIGVIALLNKFQFANNYTGNGKKGLSGFFSNIGATFKNLTKANDFQIALKAVKTIGLVMLELSIAIKILSTIDWQQMAVAVVGMGAVLTELVLFIKGLQWASKSLDPKAIKSTSSMLTKLGFAMIELALALKIIASMNWGELAVGLVGMGAVLTELGAFVIAVSKWAGEGSALKITALGPAMIGIGLAMIEIAAAMKILSTMDVTGSQTAMVAMFAALGEIAIFVVAVSKLTKGGALGFIGVATGLTIMAAAISVLSVAVYALSKIGWDAIVEGCKALALLVATVGAAGAILGIFSPLLLLGSVALIAFAGALNLASSAMLKAVTAFVAFQAVGSDFTKVLTTMMTDAFAAVIALIPTFILGIVEAVISVAGELVRLVGTLINVVLTAINENLPNIISNIISFVGAVLDGLYNGITILGPKIFNVVFGLLNCFIEQLTLNLPTLLQNLFTFLVTAINTFADIVRNGGADLGAAFGNLAGAVIEGIFGAIGGILGGIGKGVMSIGGSFMEGFRGVWSRLFGEGDQKEDQQTAGNKIVDHVSEGMESNKTTVYDKAEEIGKETAKKMEDKEEAKKSGLMTLDGLLSSLQDSGKLSAIYNAGVAAAQAFNRGYRAYMVQRSPSRLMMKQAGYTMEGLIEGFKDTTGVERSGDNVGNAIYKSISSALSLANDILDESLNPVITPVLDLSQVEQNSGAIQGLFNNGFAYNGALAINAQQLALANQNALLNQQPPVEIEMNNTFEINGISDLSDPNLVRQMAADLYDEINTLLGNEL